tara:strand:- start:561 stop:1688 length:1128 start_codon:yes stop_codon:yes gene_type:complete
MGKKDDTDYSEIAQIQGAENREVVRDQTYANRPTQYTPYGSTTWDNSQVIDPSTGKPVTQWSQTTSLTPELQYILNQQQAIAAGKGDVAGMLVNRMGSEYGQQMDWSGLSPMGEVPMGQYTRPGGDRKAAEDAAYNQAQSRIAPQQESQRESLELKMRNQGLNPQDAAWQSQVQSQAQGFNDQNNQALWSANQAGRQNAESVFGQRLSANAQNYGQAMGNSAYANQIRQQQLTEAMTQRGFSLNEINALMSGDQVGLPQMPNFAETSAAQPADYQGAAAQQASAKAASNPANALLGAGATLGAAALSNEAIFASDRRLKYNIKRIGTNKGYPWYSYNLKYDGSAHEGVMADEIPEKFTVDLGGLKAVNYSALLGD